jgi:hypothetical protein
MSVGSTATPVHPTVEKGVRLWRATLALSNRADGIPRAIGSTALPMAACA